MLRLLPRISALVVLAILSAGSALAREPPSDAQVHENIIKGKRRALSRDGAPCACPYNLARNGSNCGARSAYSRPGGAEQLCYPKDVSDGIVETWKRAHP